MPRPTIMPPSLTPSERRALRARAHPLHPVVIVGSRGLTASVLKEAEIALRSHELIKMKLASDDRGERTSQCAALAEALAAAPVQQIGKIVVFYRENVATIEAASAAPATPRTAARRAPSRARAASRPPLPAAIGGARKSGKTPIARPSRTPAKPRPTRKRSASRR